MTDTDMPERLAQYRVLRHRGQGGMGVESRPDLGAYGRSASSLSQNRYVDGLATWAPRDLAAYGLHGERLAREGYLETPTEPEKV